MVMSNAAAPRCAELRWLYALLCVCRVLSALLGHGYLHPDEHFQVAEVAAVDVGAVVFAPPPPVWEFQGPNPIRSVAAISLFGHAPLLLLRLFAWAGCGGGGNDEAAVACAEGLWQYAFAMQRLWACVLSFAVDWAVRGVCRAYKVSPWGPLVAVAGSWVTLVLLVRPFSNTAETLALAAAIRLVFRRRRRRSDAIRSCCCWRTCCSRTRKTSAPPPPPPPPPPPATAAVVWEVAEAGAVGALLAAGVFVRFTFVGLAAPLAGCYAWQRFRMAATPRRRQRRRTTTAAAGVCVLALVAVGGLAGAAVAALGGCTADSLYYWRVRPMSAPPDAWTLPLSVWWGDVIIRNSASSSSSGGDSSSAFEGGASADAGAALAVAATAVPWRFTPLRALEYVVVVCFPHSCATTTTQYHSQLCGGGSTKT